MIEGEEELKYIRVGYVNQGRKSDSLLKLFLDRLPGNGVLPLRWHYRSYDAFMRRHGHLGMVVWAAANNSHLLIINGYKVLRIWTDTSHSCYVDVNDPVDAQMQIHSWGKTETIPEKNIRKSKPFTKRWKISEQYQMLHLVEAVKRAYGLDK